MKHVIAALGLSLVLLSVLGETAAMAGLCTNCPPPRCGGRRC